MSSRARYAARFHTDFPTGGARIASRQGGSRAREHTRSSAYERIGPAAPTSTRRALQFRAGCSRNDPPYDPLAGRFIGSARPMPPPSIERYNRPTGCGFAFGRRERACARAAEITIREITHRTASLGLFKHRPVYRIIPYAP